jgi:hypothetical protein
MNTTAARRLARNLMIKHGVGMWRLTFVNHMSYAALCNHKDLTISLAVEYVQAYTVEQVTQLVLHEIAHALRGRVVPDAHDEKWLKLARRIGYSGDAVLPASYPKPRIVWDVVCTSTGLILQSPTPVDPTTCKLCNTPGCVPETERRQIVNADIHNRPAPPHIYAPFFRRLKSIFSRG